MPAALMRDTGRRYQWPELQLNIWMLVVLAGSSFNLGVFSWFMTVQTQLQLGIPWLFPYMVTIGSLGVAFIVAILFLAAQRLLLPGIIILGSFGMWVLSLTGMIETALQMFGGQANINANCQNYVTNQEFFGNTVETLAWLTQNNICNCWRAAFAFEVICTTFFLWMIIMSWQVHRDAR